MSETPAGTRQKLVDVRDSTTQDRLKAGTQRLIDKHDAKKSGK